MLSVEDAAHGTIEDFTQNIVGKAKIEQEGGLRRDRGEQLLDKIRGRSLNLHNMLSVEDAAHGSIEDFTQNIVGKAKSLRADIAREKDARVVTEGRHGQRV